jgi:hypothetical protein
MGGMFSVVKVREGLAANDYKDPGWFQHPPGTIAYESKDARPKHTEAPRSPDHKTAAEKPRGKEIEFKVVKPKGHGAHQ